MLEALTSPWIMCLWQISWRHCKPCATPITILYLITHSRVGPLWAATKTCTKEEGLWSLETPWQVSISFILHPNQKSHKMKIWRHSTETLFSPLMTQPLHATVVWKSKPSEKLRFSKKYLKEHLWSFLMCMIKSHFFTQLQNVLGSFKLCKPSIKPQVYKHSADWWSYSEGAPEGFHAELENKMETVFYTMPKRVVVFRWCTWLMMPSSMRKSLSFPAAFSPRLCFLTARSWPQGSTLLYTFAYQHFPTRFSARHLRSLGSCS